MSDDDPIDTVGSPTDPIDLYLSAGDLDVTMPPGGSAHVRRLEIETPGGTLVITAEDDQLLLKMGDEGDE